MRPWVLHMREAQVAPRVLADDLLLYASRERHASRTMQGMVLSRQYFADIGAKVADNKCFLTSTCLATRAKLRNIAWPDVHTPGGKYQAIAHGTSTTATHNRHSQPQPTHTGQKQAEAMLFPGEQEQQQSTTTHEDASRKGDAAVWAVASSPSIPSASAGGNTISQPTSSTTTSTQTITSIQVVSHFS